MKKSKISIYLMILISIILCVPSIIYLINNKTVDGFDSYYTYTLYKWSDPATGIMSGIIVIGLLLVFSILYFFIIKKENKIFKNMKQILIFITIIAFVFMLILPYLSSDIYYYIGDSWLASKYNKNPYYTAVLDLQEQGINDEILNNTGYWKATTSVYGPLWNSIATFLVSFSFGSVTIALFIFKIASYAIHILNSCLIYKITRSKKYMLIYGLNPLILVEFLSNVHNDIYLVLFILLALYFLIRKKNILFTILFLGLSVSLKYSTALLVPFILIYCFREKNVSKRILYCILSGVSIIGFVILLYLPYYRDMTIFTNMLVQGSKYSQSIMLFLMNKINKNIFQSIETLCIPTFMIIYLTILFIMLFKKDISFRDVMRKYNFIMLLFIFIVLTSFQKWYVLWLLPTIIWQSEYMRKFILYLTVTALIPSIGYFMVGGDPYVLGITYSIKILVISTFLFVINLLINKFLRSNKFEVKEK